MLVNPEIYALLNRLSQAERETPKTAPRVTRGARLDKGGLDKPRDILAYAPETADRDEEVDYLNERESKVSFYA